MLEEERIARIGSNDPESHLGIPCSHVCNTVHYVPVVNWYKTLSNGTRLQSF
jgi:hypothetical protein